MENDVKYSMNIYDDFVKQIQEFEESEAFQEALYMNSTTEDYTICELYVQNKEVQLTLAECFSNLQGKLYQVLDAKERCPPDVKETIEKKAFKPLHLFTAPYFRDIRGFHPSGNEDTKEKKMLSHVTSYLIPSQPWSKQEHKLFLEIVKRNAQEVVLRPFKIRVKFLIEKLKRNLSLQHDEIQTATEVSCIQNKIRIIRCKPFEELWKEENIKLDWLTISNEMMNMGCDRSPEACELMWENCLHLSISKKCFTAEEDSALKELVELHDGENWPQIAESLKTNRTPLQYYERFQGHLNKELAKKFWTSEDDQRLIETVEFCRIGDFIPWKKVLQFMNGWTLLQLQNRWDRCLKPQNREGPWTPEEDAVLLLCAHCSGHRWKMISDFLHGRSSYVCRERYTNVLDPALHTGHWTWEEDKLLLNLLSSHGEKWGVISHYLVGRTDNMVNQRCNVLRRYRPDIYQKALLSEKDLAEVLPDRQFARTNKCKDINTKRENIRTTALNYAKSAVLKSRCNKFDVSECQTFKDLSKKLNFSELQEISRILLPEPPEDMIKRPKPVYYLEMPVKVEPEDEDQTEDEESEDLCLTDSEEKVDNIQKEEEEEVEEQPEVASEDQEVEVLMTQEEIDSLEFEFTYTILPIAVFGCRPLENPFIFKSRKLQVEYNILCTYLFKAFHLKDIKKLDCADDEKGALVRGTDYNKSLNKIIEMLIAPKGNLPIVLPMTITSIKTFIMILLMRQTFRKLLNAGPPKVMNNLDVILNGEERSSQNCSGCFAIQQYGADPTISRQRQSNIETVCIECVNAKRIMERFKVMFYRFFATFAYPAHLAIHKPSQIQLLKLLMNDTVVYFDRRHQKRERKRVRSIADSDDFTDE